MVITQNYRVTGLAYFLHLFFEHVEDAFVKIRVGFFDLKNRFVFEVVHVNGALSVEVIRCAVAVVDVATYKRERKAIDNGNMHSVRVSQDVSYFVVDCH